MEALFNTALVGLGILLAVFLFNAFFIYRGRKLYREASKQLCLSALADALDDEDLTQRDVTRTLLKLNRNVEILYRIKPLVDELPRLSVGMIILIIVSKLF